MVWAILGMGVCCLCLCLGLLALVIWTGIRWKYGSWPDFQISFFFPSDDCDLYLECTRIFKSVGLIIPSLSCIYSWISVSYEWLKEEMEQRLWRQQWFGHMAFIPHSIFMWESKKLPHKNNTKNLCKIKPQTPSLWVHMISHATFRVWSDH